MRAVTPVGQGLAARPAHETAEPPQGLIPQAEGRRSPDRGDASVNAGLTFTSLRTLAWLPESSAAAVVHARLGELRERAMALPVVPVAGESASTWEGVIAALLAQQQRLVAFGRPQLEFAGAQAAQFHQPARRLVFGRCRAHQALQLRAGAECHVDAQAPELEAVAAVPEAVVGPDAHLHRVVAAPERQEAEERDPLPRVLDHRRYRGQAPERRSLDDALDALAHEQILVGLRPQQPAVERRIAGRLKQRPGVGQRDRAQRDAAGMAAFEVIGERRVIHAQYFKRVEKRPAAGPAKVVLSAHPGARA